MSDNEFSDNLPEEQLSKTRRKKNMHALQELGETLTTLPPALLAKCNLPAELLQAITEYKRIPDKRGAKKRQMQFIGRVMRDVDAEPILQVLKEQGQQAELEKRRFHHLDEVREQLLAGDQAMLDELIRDFDDFDIQYARALIRQAQKEQVDNKAHAASRKLFAYLKELTAKKGR